MTGNEWAYCTERKQPCLVIERQVLWGKTLCRVWFPLSNTVATVPSDQLDALSSADSWSKPKLTYIAAAARIAETLAQNILLAPIEAPVIPLPHQIKVLSQAVGDDKVRYLLADEVGLGKTIEAGLILRELKLRGLVRRVLVVAPKGLTAQWVSEMRLHFNEDFRLVFPDELETVHRMMSPQSEYIEAPTGGHERQPAPISGHSSNPWQLLNQVVVPMDSVKPIEKRRGWGKTELAAYNRRRFEDLLAAGWDLIVVDEAHRLGGTTDQVARYRLGRGLSEAAPYLLLLSGTPHQGKTDAFRRLLSLLDEKAFPDDESINHDNVKSYVIRSLKRQAVDADGNPLFKPRLTTTMSVDWEDKHKDQHRLYEGVSAYVREGYNQALKEKRNYIGFLMILMQRLVTSSTRAIRTALEKRLAALESSDGQLTFFDALDTDEWSDLDGQAQLDSVIKGRFKALDNEKEEVRILLETATKVEQQGSDAKAERLLELIYKLQQEDGDPELKVLIFTEFVPTQDMLAEFLKDRGFRVAQINGSMDIDERLSAQRQFAGPARILISTDAGGEGLNLQFCHVVVNFDLPWNPMRIEQRIGRVDRIGQAHPVRAVNFILTETVEFRVREVLEQKLAVILKEFGVDKTGDVLDSAQAGEIFDGLYVDAIMDPSGINDKVDGFLRKVKQEIKTRKDATAVLEDGTALDTSAAKSLAEHPMPHWIEQMTVNYLHAYGGQAVRKARAWHLTWPNGLHMGPVVFTARDAEAIPSAEHVTLESPRIRALVADLPRFISGQIVPRLEVKGLPPGIQGLWSLWRLDVSCGGSFKRRLMPLFRQTDGRILAPTARRIWEQIMAGELVVGESGGHPLDAAGFTELWTAAENNGRPQYEELVHEHNIQLAREKDKATRAFAARRRIIERIGLPEVRKFRLAELEQEAATWAEDFKRREAVLPEMNPVVVAYVEGSA